MIPPQLLELLQLLLLLLLQLELLLLQLLLLLLEQLLLELPQLLELLQLFPEQLDVPPQLWWFQSYELQPLVPTYGVEDVVRCLPRRSPNNATASALLRGLRSAYIHTVLPFLVSLPGLRSRIARNTSSAVSRNSLVSIAKATNTETNASRNNTTRNAILPPRGLPNWRCTMPRATRLWCSAPIS
nr:hypothetical protein [Lentzea waywayandensis]